MINIPIVYLLVQYSRPYSCWLLGPFGYGWNVSRLYVSLAGSRSPFFRYLQSGSHFFPEELQTAVSIAERL